MFGLTSSNSMAGKYLEIEKLKERFLECIVCNQNFDEQDHAPLLMKCLHTFCFSCLKKIVKNEELICPICQAVHSVKDNDISIFPKDITRRDLVDFVRASSNETPLNCDTCVEKNAATHRCKECQGFICDGCFQMHGKMNTFKEHNPLALKDISQDSFHDLQHFSHEKMCGKEGHEKELLKMYCSTCRKPVCTVCACTTHKEDHIRTILEVFQEENTSIQDLSKEVVKKIENSEKVIEVVDKEIVLLPEKVEEQKSAIRAEFANAISMLERRREELCRIMEEHENRKVKLLEAQKEGMQRYKESCIEAIQFLETSLAHKNKAAFLDLVPTIRSRFLELNETHLDMESYAKAGCINFEKFSLKEFSNTAAQLGRVLCTYVYVPKSSVTLSSATAEVGQEIEFTLDLKSVDGIPVENEKTAVIITSENGEDMLHHISCKYVKDRKVYMGKWHPGEPRKYSILVTCNGIAMDFQLNMLNAGNVPLPVEKLKQPLKDSKKTRVVGRTLSGREAQTAGECKICMDNCNIPKQLPCKHNFCKKCIEPYLKTKQKCPFCQTVFGKIYGDQPKGRISFQKEKKSLPGYKECDTIIVTYIIDADRQGREHPNPGRELTGRLERTAFLPNNDDGQLIAKLLNIAFKRRLIFTVDKSQTTGKEGALVWNDIHHKTKRDGGPEQYGYPDGTYLKRVFEELELKGVTPELADDKSEFEEYTALFSSH